MKISVILDARTARPTLKMQATIDRVTRRLSIGVQVDNTSQWDGHRIVGRPDADRLNKFVASRVSLAEGIALELEQLYGRNGFTFDLLFGRIREVIDPKRQQKINEDARRIEQQNSGVYGYYRKVMSGYDGRTWQIYETTLRRIREYAEDKAGKGAPSDYERISAGGVPSEPAQRWLEQLRFEDIDEAWLDGWREAMADTKGPATQSIYLRCLRHVCNEAYKHDVTAKYIFKRYPIPKPQGDVHPLSEDEFVRLFRGAAPQWTEQYRQMAWFGFCTIGMNMVDCHKLEWSQIRDGYMRYVRSKTGRKYCIKLEQEALAVIDQQRGNGKVFDWSERYKMHTDYTQHLNDGLKAILGNDMHYYRLRHTWATFAARIKIPKDEIALCLGHGRKTVTDVYVDYDQEVIDAANRRVIDYAKSLLK